MRCACVCAGVPLPTHTPPPSQPLFSLSPPAQRAPFPFFPPFPCLLSSAGVARVSVCACVCLCHRAPPPLLCKFETQQHKNDMRNGFFSFFSHSHAHARARSLCPSQSPARQLSAQCCVAGALSGKAKPRRQPARANETRRKHTHPSLKKDRRRRAPRSLSLSCAALRARLPSQK